MDAGSRKGSDSWKLSPSMIGDAFAHASTIDRSDIAIMQGLLDTLEEEEVEEIDCLVCDNCGNESWYIVVPKPNGRAVAFQVQICTKCGFAVQIAYRPIGAQIRDAGDSSRVEMT